MAANMIGVNKGPPLLLGSPCYHPAGAPRPAGHPLSQPYTFVLYDLSRLDRERLSKVFREGLKRSLSAAGLPAEAADLLCGSDQPLFTKTHNRQEVAFLNRAWDRVFYIRGDTMARQLTAETDFVLNLAFKEYNRAVEPHLPKSIRFLTCTFGEWKGGKVIEKGTMCKMAQGQMVRWLAENNVTNRADIRAFDQLGYRFQPELSNESHCVFLKSGTEK